MTESQVGAAVTLYIMIGAIAAAVLSEEGRHSGGEVFALAAVWPVAVLFIAWRALGRR